MANSFGQLGSLKDKLLSKAFPVPASELPDGVLEANPPELVFELGEKLTADRLTCFASGQGRIEFRTAGNRVSVKEPKAFDRRRFRYQCTHRAGDASYYRLSPHGLNLGAPED